MDPSSTSSSDSPSFTFLPPSAPPPAHPGFDLSGAAPKVKPLKRGAACQACRKRKLRCSGERPCATCSKTRSECVYDEPSKSKGRMKQLEDKIASLENFLTRAEATHSTPSSYGLPPLNLVHDKESPVDTDSPNSSGSGSSHPPRPRPHQQPLPSSANPSNPNATAQESFSLALEELFGNGGMMDESGGGEGNDAMTSRPVPSFDPSRPTASDFLNARYTKSQPPSSAQAYPAWDPEQGRQGSTGPQLPSPPLSYPSFPPTPSYSLPTNSVRSTIFDTFPPTLRASTSQSNNPTRSPPSFAPPSTSSSGGFLFRLPSREDTTIDLALRSHLLGLFFQKARNFAFSLHVPRFIASLDGPPDQQPNASLLFAMYACAARFSNVAEVRALDSWFIESTRQQIQLEMQDMSTNLLQTTQASICIGILMYSRASYVEGWVQAGITIRLVSACSLHRITSSSFALYSEETHPYQLHTGPHTLKRKPFTRLKPPRDSLDLGERIRVFWSAFMLDRVGSAGSGWPPGIPDENVETPWPRPFEEYEKDVVAGSDQSLSDLLSLDSVAPNDHEDGIATTYMKAITLFHQAARLGDSITVRKAPRALCDDTPTPIPQVLLDLERGLRRFVDALPPSASTMKVVGGIPPWNSTVPIGPLSFGIDPTVFSANTVIYAAFMLLYEDMAMFVPSYRMKSVQAACGGVSLISHIVDLEFGHLDITVPIFWRHFARLLLEEAKRLGALGELEEASLRQVDVEVLVLSMKRMGEVWDVGETQASFIEQLQTLDISKEERGGGGNVA